MMVRILYLMFIRLVLLDQPLRVIPWLLTCLHEHVMIKNNNSDVKVTG